MALVPSYGYGSSDEELSDQEESVAGPSTTITPSVPATAVPSSSKDGPLRRPVVSFFEDSEEEMEEDEKETALDKFLPKPKENSDFPMEEEEEVGPIPPKKTYGDEEKPPPPVSFHNVTANKVKGVMRIAAPNLKDFEDDEMDGGPKKFMQSSKKGSGLFAILPQPRVGMLADKMPASFLKAKTQPNLPTVASTSSSTSTATSSSSSGSRASPKSMIPDSVKNATKRPPPSKLEEIKAKYLKQDANVRIVSRSKKSEKLPRDSDDSDEEDASDFFSFNSEMNIDDDALERLKLPMPDFSQRGNPPEEEPEEVEESFEEANAPGSSIPSEDIMKYVQNRKQKGKNKEVINFIDVNADDLKPDSTEWVKNITDESAIPARRAKGLGGMQRKKHQITYLAVEAKAREQELQQQWANNRQNARMSRMKYGF